VSPLAHRSVLDVQARVRRVCSAPTASLTLCVCRLRHHTHTRCTPDVCALVQDKQMACMDACACEYSNLVPKLKADCQAGLKKLGA
jgi:hypothetical protein